MPTLYGSWQGTDYKARIYCVYSVSYTADHTQAIYSISFGVEFGGSISDSVNTWAVSGDCGSASGSNVSYSIPSGGGTKIFRSGETAQEYGNASVSAQIDNVEAVGGGVISATFSLPSGDLAPYFTDSTCVATPGVSSAVISGFAATGNGGTLNDIQVQYNTTASATGATNYTRGSYGNPTISGLAPNTTYYYRIRVQNSTYGWSAYSAWQSFKTLAGTPGVPGTGWSMTPSQDGFSISGNTVADNGGSAITGWNTYYNTSATLTGATTLSGSDAAVAPSASGLNPGTYYVAIAAKNVNGVGVLSDWKSVTLLPGAYVNVGGVWKEANVYINVGGVWKIATRYNKVGTVWKA